LYWCTYTSLVFVPADGGTPVFSAASCSPQAQGTYGASLSSSITTDAGVWYLNVQGVADAGTNCWVSWSIVGAEQAVK